VALYYTDEQRAKALATRKANNRWKAEREGRIEPEDVARDHFRAAGIDIGKVPRPQKKPKPSDYKLPAGIEDAIKRLDKESAIQREKLADKMRSERRYIFWMVTIFLVVPGAWILVSWLSIGVVTAILLGFIPSIIWIAWGFSTPELPDIKLTGMRKAYEDYRTDLKNWRYWERKRLRSHWSKMGGIEFEREMAKLFQLVGFKVELTKATGDGGIDLILYHEDRKIAVQCKRYNKDVGPHTIRDLWGTMHHLGYDEGCIATTAYFTDGVKDFARNKPIFLINMTDILETIGDKGIDSLREKMRIENAPRGISVTKKMVQASTHKQGPALDRTNPTVVLPKHIKDEPIFSNSVLKGGDSLPSPEELARARANAKSRAERSALNKLENAMQHPNTEYALRTLEAVKEVFKK